MKTSQGMLSGKVFMFSEVDLMSHTGIRDKMLITRHYLSQKTDSEVALWHINTNELCDFDNTDRKFRFGFSLFLYLKLLKLLKSSNVKMAYFRNPTWSFSFLFFPLFILFLRILKIKVFVEIPTWPFIYEFRFLKRVVYTVYLPFLLMAYILSGTNVLLCSPNRFPLKLKRFYRISNYVNDSYPLALPGNDKPTSEPAKIVFTGIANLALWHGFERLINLIVNYSGDDELEFNIITKPTDEATRIKNLIRDKQYGFVNFYEDISSKEVDRIFNRTNIGVDTLGRDLGNFSLKSREYCARGLPFIKVHSDPFFDKKLFCYNVTVDTRLSDILIWYKENASNFKPQLIRDYGINSLSIDAVWKSSGAHDNIYGF